MAAKKFVCVIHVFLIPTTIPLHKLLCRIIGSPPIHFSGHSMALRLPQCRLLTRDIQYRMTFQGYYQILRKPMALLVMVFNQLVPDPTSFAMDELISIMQPLSPISFHRPLAILIVDLLLFHLLALAHRFRIIVSITILAAFLHDIDRLILKAHRSSLVLTQRILQLNKLDHHPHQDDKYPKRTNVQSVEMSFLLKDLMVRKPNEKHTSRNVLQRIFRVVEPHENLHRQLQTLQLVLSRHHPMRLAPLK